MCRLPWQTLCLVESTGHVSLYYIVLFFAFVCSFGLAFADYKCAVLLDSLFEQGRKAMARWVTCVRVGVSCTYVQ